MNFRPTLCLSLFIYLFVYFSYFLPPLFLSTFFKFLSSVLYFLCLLLSSPALIFLLGPFFWLFIPFYSFLACCLFPSFFRPISTFISALWCSSSTLCPQPVPLSSYSAVPSTTFLSSRLLLRSSHKGQMYKTIDILCPTGADGLPQCPGGKSYCTCVHIIKIELGALVQIILSDHSKSKRMYLCRHSFSKALLFV
jgi:hypothetical protein